MVRIFLSALALSLAVGVAIHEWRYHEDHPGRTGVSGVLVVLAIAVALIAFRQLWGAWEHHKATEPERQRDAEWRRRLKAEHDASDLLRKLDEDEETVKRNYLAGEFELAPNWRYDEVTARFLYFKPPNPLWELVGQVLAWLVALFVLVGPIVAVVGEALGWWDLGSAPDP